MYFDKTEMQINNVIWNESDTTTAMHRVTQQTITDLICS